jgi:5-hydroxyisourate hydrolase
LDIVAVVVLANAWHRIPQREVTLLGRLTTHVLDTAHGTPAEGMAVTLYRRVADRFESLRSVTTNADGRAGEPLLEGDALLPGRYRLAFAAGAYFRARGLTLPEPAFVDEVVIDFGIADATAHYHVPLLVSPWSYSTYRGS